MRELTRVSKKDVHTPNAEIARFHNFLRLKDELELDFDRICYITDVVRLSVNKLKKWNTVIS